MSYQDILYEKNDRIATLTFNRPDRLNAITNVMRSEILEAMRDASSDAASCAVPDGGSAATARTGSPSVCV